MLYRQAVSRVERRWRRAEILDRLYSAGPAAVYAGLLHYATGRTKANGQPWNAAGWTEHAFEEIFGTRPRPQDRGEPKALPNLLIDEWAAGRKRKPPPQSPTLRRTA